VPLQLDASLALMRILWLLLLTISSYAQTANLSGIWAGEELDDQGVTKDVAFRLVQNGEKLTGLLYYDQKFNAYVNTDIPLENGVFRNSKVRFLIKTVGYTGKIVMAYYGELKSSGELELWRKRLEASKLPVGDTEWETPTKSAKPLILRRK
jgi:hypothetical protein